MVYLQMRTFAWLFYLVFTWWLFICCNRQSGETKNEIKSMNMPPTIDVHSVARPDEVVVTHLDLALDVDFASRMLSGKATLTIENKTQADTLYLDTQHLTIERVTVGATNQLAPFTLGKEATHLGQPLAIQIEPDTKQVTLHYQTSPQAAALQWLTPEQTAGKKHPFLFTQSQAILARSWVPIQDSPGIRFTYNAQVKVPPALLALMSADNPTKKNPEGVYTFRMDKPIPAYLLALSVGDLVFEPLGKRTGVYAEPVTLKESIYEFADLEKMLETAEQLYGAYDWGRYDLLVLPPSFPFGGMENPKLTFATPTILAGDRSLTSLVAHELAHSWSGNLVTNQTWNDFWLNEGFTVYFERRIMEALYGKSYADMLAALGFQDLQETVTNLKSQPDDTHLKLDLAGRNPDDGVSDIAYEKGYFFLRTIEQMVGRVRWDAFVQRYFQAFAYQSMNTENFLQYLQKELFSDHPQQWEQLHVNAWVYGPGIPANVPKVSSERFAAVEKAAQSWQTGTSASKLDTSQWSSHEWLHFIRQLPDALSFAQLSELDQAFKFTQSGNSEVLAAWLERAIKSRYSPAYGALQDFLVRVGRRKFLMPLYKALMQSPDGKEMAKAIYANARPNYHSVASHTIDELLEK